MKKGITIKDIQEMKRLRGLGYSTLKIGRMFDIDHTTVMYHTSHSIKFHREERKNYQVVDGHQVKKSSKSYREIAKNQMRVIRDRVGNKIGLEPHPVIVGRIRE